jgi:hypothetical protein
MSDFLKSVAPTVASALLGPFAGVAVAGLGRVFGVDGATTESITKLIQQGSVTPEAMAKLQEMEGEFREHEAERGYKYSELEFKDRDSARQANVAGGTQQYLFWLSLFLLAVSVGAELCVLFYGYPKDRVDPVLVGRILGLLDAVAIQILGYWFGSSSGSKQKTELLNQK